MKGAMIDSSSRWNRRLLIFAGATLATLLLAWVDLRVHHNVPLGLLYLFPMALISTVTRRWEVLIAAALCTLVAEYADAFPWNTTQGIARDALYFIAYAAEGMYITEMIAKRRSGRLHLDALTEEVAARKEAEEQLQLLVDCSSAAIVTADEMGKILQANQAAIRLFAPDEQEPATLKGSLAAFLPALACAPLLAHDPKSLRTMLQCQGFRSNRDPFVADVWFSTYGTPCGTRMTAVVADVSEEFRNREQSNLEQILDSSRLVVGALAHEMRNVCGAIGLVCERLAAHTDEGAESEDLKALRQLTGMLERMTSVELSRMKRSASPIRLQHVIDEARIIFANASPDKSIEMHWPTTTDLPLVWADAQGLLQVFLNLIRNAHSALANTSHPNVCIGVHCHANTLEVQIADNGPGVPDPENLFRRFQDSSRISGLGLYLSRAMMMSFRGDIRYEPANPGARFIVELLIAK